MKIKKRKTKFDSADKRFVKLIVILILLFGTFYIIKHKINKNNKPYILEMR